MEKIFNVTDYGIIKKNAECTKIIQKAIDDCFANGGGVVCVSAGEYTVSTIRLRTGVTLYLKKGAHIIGTKNPDNYCNFINDMVEPLPEEYLTTERWKPVKERTGSDFMLKPCGRWGNGIIRAIDAENIGIIGEEDSYIDGQDCFDELGEEFYRGPHAISMHGCKNIKFSGYTIKNSANWAHALFQCENIAVDNVTVEAGHDGIHITSCKNATINRCKFFTGDDCIAGIDNLNIFVSDCELNTACSAFRFGGTNVYIQKCKMYGPAKYLFRGSLSNEEKRTGKKTQANSSHRYNMLSSFTYYSDFSRKISCTPGNIVMSDCTIENADRFLHYNFSGNEPWQSNKPLESITFENICASGIKMPLTAYGDADKKLTLKLKNCDISFVPNENEIAFIRAAHCKNIQLEQVKINNLSDVPMILQWSDIPISIDDVNIEIFSSESKTADIPFEIDWI